MSYFYKIFAVMIPLCLSGCTDHVFENPFDPEVPTSVWAPAELIATTDSESNIHLSWEAKAIIKTGYKIQRRENDSDFVTLDSTFENSYTDIPPDHSRTYSYQVRAWLEDKLSTPSNIKSIHWIPLGDLIWSYPVGHYGTSTLTFSPDNRYLATGSTGLVNNEYCGPVTLFDAESGAILWTGYHSWGVTALDFTEDNSFLISGSEDTLVKVWNVNTGALVWQAAHPARITHVAFSRDGNLVASGCYAGYLRIRNAQSGVQLWQYRHTHPTWQVAVYDLAFHPEAHQIVSAGGEYTIKCFNSDNGNEMWFQDIGIQINQIMYDHSGNSVIAGGGGYQSGWVSQMDSQNGTVLWRVNLPDQVSVIHMTSNDSLITAASTSGHIWILNADDGTILRELQHGSHVHAIQFSPDGYKLLSAGNNNTVSVWGVVSGKLLWSGTQNREIYSAEFSPDGTKMASISYEGQVKCWWALNNWIISDGE